MKPLAPERIALLKAADVLERDGWCQGVASMADGRKCMVGAIAASGFYAIPLESMLAEYLDPDWKMSPRVTIANWNDAPGRTQAEVVAALRGAAVHGL